MQVKDIMTTQTEFIAADASLHDAARTMDECDVGFLPVRDGGQLVGVVTDRDLALRPARNPDVQASSKVADIMTPSAHAVWSHTPLAGAATVMRKKGVRRLLVLGDKQQLVGVVSLSDIAMRSDLSELPGKVLSHLASARAASSTNTDSTTE